MTDASSPAAHPASDVSPVDFNWAAFRAACRAQGAATASDCAALTGIPERTLYELRRRPASASVGNALQIRAVTGLGLDDLFPATPGRQLSEAA